MNSHHGNGAEKKDPAKFFSSNRVSSSGKSERCSLSLRKKQPPEQYFDFGEFKEDWTDFKQHMEKYTFDDFKVDLEDFKLDLDEYTSGGNKDDLKEFKQEAICSDTSSEREIKNRCSLFPKVKKRENNILMKCHLEKSNVDDSNKRKTKIRSRILRKIRKGGNQ